MADTGQPSPVSSLRGAGAEAGPLNSPGLPRLPIVFPRNRVYSPSRPASRPAPRDENHRTIEENYTDSRGMLRRRLIVRGIERSNNPQTTSDRGIARARSPSFHPPTVHWASPVATSPESRAGENARDNVKETASIDTPREDAKGTAGGSVQIMVGIQSDIELVELAERRAKDNRIAQTLNTGRAEIKTVSVLALQKDLHILVCGHSRKILSVSVTQAVVRVKVLAITSASWREFPISYKIAVSSEPIPSDAILSSSAGTLLERDYTILKGRPCMVVSAWWRAPSELDAEGVYLVGTDLETGEKIGDLFDARDLLSVAIRPIARLVPQTLLGLGSARVCAASLSEGYYMAIKERSCKIICVDFPVRPCEEERWKRVRVVGMDTLASTDRVRLLRGVDVDMESMVTVGRYGIDPGPCPSREERVGGLSINNLLNNMNRF